MHKTQYDVFMLNDYEQYLKYLFEKNYTVCNFKELEEKYKDYSELPEKLVVLRHDIHERDIANAYKMIKLEQKYFKKNIATYFVQWNFIGSSQYEENKERQFNEIYEKFIEFCISNKIHVTPHISIFCHSYLNLYNRNNNNIELLKSKSTSGVLDKNGNDLLSTSVNEMNYHILIPNQNICITCENKQNNNNIKILTNNIRNYLKLYKKKWEKRFNTSATIFSTHGDGTLLTKKFNPNIFGSMIMFENIMKNANSPILYCGEKSKYKLHYKPDNCLKRDKILKNFYDESKFHSQILVHPRVWAWNGEKNIL